MSTQMRLGDLCPRCNVGNIESPRSKLIANRTIRLRYLKCDYCGATGKEHVPLDDRGRVRSANTPFVQVSFAGAVSISTSEQTVSINQE